jgi:23S rRNA (uracil1939-C5)-methyltransferase
LKSKTFTQANEYKVGDRIEVAIEKIVPNGFGIAFAEGLTIFVALAAAGDIASVELTQVKHSTAFAEIIEVVSPSPDRVTPPCVYFGTCGGCDFQQLNYAAQLDAKVGIIQDSLTRIGKIADHPAISVIPSPAEFGYRSRAQWHVDTAGRKLGYFKRGSRDAVDIERCIVLTPTLEETLENVRQGMEWSSFWNGKFQIEAAAGENGQVSVYSSEITGPTNEISYSAAGEKYFYSAQSFFQGNQLVIEKLIETAIGGYAGEHALDLYCGVGLFTLPLARKFTRVTGVEEHSGAVDFAENNVRSAGLSNIDLVRSSVRGFLSGELPEEVDLVLLDPPRAGTEKVVIENIIKIGPEHVSYVSCEPSVLARDLRRFADGGYSIDSITAIDLFPQTHHVETVVRLSKPIR